MMRMNSNASVREIFSAGVLSAAVLSAALDGGFVTQYLAIRALVSVPIATLDVFWGALQAAIVLATWRRLRER
jgi:hypothetical protein